MVENAGLRAGKWPLGVTLFLLMARKNSGCVLKTTTQVGPSLTIQSLPKRYVGHQFRRCWTSVVGSSRESNVTVRSGPPYSFDYLLVKSGVEKSEDLWYMIYLFPRSSISNFLSHEVGVDLDLNSLLLAHGDLSIYVDDSLRQTFSMPTWFYSLCFGLPLRHQELGIRRIKMCILDAVFLDFRFLIHWSWLAKSDRAFSDWVLAFYDESQFLIFLVDYRLTLTLICVDLPSYLWLPTFDTWITMSGRTLV